MKITVHEVPLRTADVLVGTVSRVLRGDPTWGRISSTGETSNQKLNFRPLRRRNNGEASKVNGNHAAAEAPLTARRCHS